MTHRRTAALSLGVAAAVSLTDGCGSGDKPAADKKVVTVLAASSLTEAFGEITQQVEKDHPDVEVRISFAASSTIVQQVNQHVDADVIALADQTSATRLSSSVVGSAQPTVFASNHLIIVTPPKNPGHVVDLLSLQSQQLNVVLCAKEVPCGRAAQTALGKVPVKPHVISYEPNVKATLTKVELGEADAGIVYVTDAYAAKDKVLGLTIKDSQNVMTHLPIYALNSHPGTQDFVDAVTSAAGRKTLSDSGFGAP